MYVLCRRPWPRGGRVPRRVKPPLSWTPPRTNPPPLFPAILMAERESHFRAAYRPDDTVRACPGQRGHVTAVFLD